MKFGKKLSYSALLLSAGTYWQQLSAVSVGNWTWLGGANTLKPNRVRGVRGFPSSKNFPGVRSGHSTLIDGTAMYLFGGTVFHNEKYSLFNDLWLMDLTTNEWTWLSGGDIPNDLGTYGTIGVAASDNMPGSRNFHAMAYDAKSRNLFIFAGFGNSEINGDGHYNDFWSYNTGSRLWTWISGFSDARFGGYGDDLIPNHPNRRCFHSMVHDEVNDALYLYGGYGYPVGLPTGIFNDLWMFNLTSGIWSLLSGNELFNEPANYGIKNAPNESNHPGSRYAHTMSMNGDSQVLFVFGGWAVGGTLNDLWQYNISSRIWTWISGSNTQNEQGSYGTLGVPAPENMPRARYVHTMFYTNGAVYVFGGGSDTIGMFDSAFYTGRAGNTFNDLWRYDASTGFWTWLSGSQSADQPVSYNYEVPGIAVPENSPSSRDGHSMAFYPLGEAFVVFSGETKSDTTDELWMYNLTNNIWKLLRYSYTAEIQGRHGMIGVPSLTNLPRARYSHAVAEDQVNNVFYIYGGCFSGCMGDLWKFDLRTGIWVWLSGSQELDTAPFYDTQGLASAQNTPGSRSNHAIIFDSVGGSVFLFGGFVFDLTIKNDLWKFDTLTRLWTWISGSQLSGALGNYGTLGVPATSNTPGSRSSYAMAFSALKRQIYLFGGSLEDGGQSGGNDLWSYDLASNMWTWLSGSKVSNAAGVYGARGVAAPENTPPHRIGATMVMDDANAELYVFGGNSINFEYFNDMWMFATTDRYWTWLGGGEGTQNPGVYGIRSMSHSKNLAPSRSNHFMAYDFRNHAAYVYGGNDNNGNFNDLWIFNLTIQQWTWLGGGHDTVTLQAGRYGVRGVGAAQNLPGPRTNTILVHDRLRRSLLMFGGYGYDSKSYRGVLNDQWRFTLLHDCPDGAVCSDTQDTFTCRSGYGWDGAQWACISCVSTGGYKSSVSMDACIPCPPNAVCSDGQSFVCDTGYQSNPITGVCVRQTVPEKRTPVNWWQSIWSINPTVGLSIVLSWIFTMVLLGFLAGFLWPNGGRAHAMFRKDSATDTASAADTGSTAFSANSADSTATKNNAESARESVSLVWSNTPYDNATTDGNASNAYTDNTLGVPSTQQSLNDTPTMSSIRHFFRW